MPGNPFFDFVCPFFGVIIGNAMWLSPMKAVLEARSKGDIGTLNPVPWSIAYANCIAWVIYGCLRRYESK